MENVEINPEQVEVFDELGIDYTGLTKIEGKRLHSFAIGNTAYTDGEYLIFFDELGGGSARDHDRFLYYMGAERERELIAKWQGVTVYEISSGRLEGYINGDESEETESEEGS